ncbi:MAG: EAL domain-containing protein [Actinomycetota bacterium]
MSEVPSESSARAGAVLEAVSFAARSFARGGEWEEVVPTVLQRLAESAEASRVYIFQNSKDSEGRLCMTETFEWCAPGISSTIEDPDNHEWPYEPGFERWIEVLRGGNVIHGPASTFPNLEREDLELEDIKSTAFVPVFVGEEWWGFMGFDDCVTPREWSPLEIDALQAAADTMGASLERHRIMVQLREAESTARLHTEHIPAITYIEMTDPDQSLGYGEIYISPQIETILGYTQEQWIGDPDSEWWDTVVHPDDVDRMREIARRTSESGEPYKLEYRVKRADGEWVWLMDEAFLVEGQEGLPPYWHGVMYDITERKRIEDELREARAKYQALVEQIPACLYLDVPTGDTYNAEYVGPQLQDILGLSPEDWLGDSRLWENSLHPDDRDEAIAEYERAIGLGGAHTQEYRMVRPDERVVWIRDDFTVIFDDDGKPQFIQGVMYDITEQREAVDALREAEEKNRALIEAIPAITYMDPLNEEEDSIYVSPQVETILGCTPEEWLGSGSWWSTHLHPDDYDRVWEVYVRYRETGEPMLQEYRMVRDDGRVVWIREQAAVLRDKEGKPWVVQGLMHDITDRKTAEEQIAFLAYHDSLTGLANRAMFEEMLEPALARARRNDLAVAVLFMDLDGFKEVNDTLGHQAGDQLLSQVAERLREQTRDTDLVARQGGDEFLVLLPDLEPGPGGDFLDSSDSAVKVAELMADRIHKALRAPFGVEDNEIHTAASIGISVFPVDSVDARTLLKNADAAMYESKKSQRGGYVVHFGEGGDPLTELSLTTRLRAAVKEQAWVLHYQPIVNLSDGKIVSVESLLRWRRPRGGLIPPGEFLPIAEEMGLLEIIGEWVLEEVCRQIVAWREVGLDLSVSFNLSPRQLWHRNLSKKITDELEESRIQPERLIVEVSESTAMTDPARTERVLRSLHENGLKLAIDDFGTGYSPPARLKHLPVDILKIDQPLTRDLPDDQEVAGFVEAVVQFAAELGIISLAEGIETENQRRFLTDLGCRLGQGYLFSRPVPAEEIVSMFETGKLPT